MEETARNKWHFQNPEYIHSSKTCRAGAYRVGRITGYPACYYYAPAPIEWGHYGRRLCLYTAWLKTGRKQITRVTRNLIYRSKVKVIRSQIQTASISQRGPTGGATFGWKGVLVYELQTCISLRIEYVEPHLSPTCAMSSRQKAVGHHVHPGHTVA